MQSPFFIEPCSSSALTEWSALRAALWPDATPEEHLQDMAALLHQPDRYAQFIAYNGDRTPAGFIEACLRRDYVNGTRSSPVAFIEGLYTVPHMRRRGVASLLVQTAEEWAKDKGCRELASDALLENVASHETHMALGFEETERVVYFRKAL